MACHCTSQLLPPYINLQITVRIRIPVGWINRLHVQMLLLLPAIYVFIELPHFDILNNRSLPYNTHMINEGWTILMKPCLIQEYQNYHENGVPVK